MMYIPTFYAVDMGLGLGLVGAVFVAGRLFDVVTDPLIGHLSDETRSRIGARKPWMLVGVPGFSIAAWLLLAPPEGAGLLYLLIASGLYFLFYTVLDVPYSSTGLEISPHVHERSVLASSKASFQVIGALFAAAAPVVLMLPIGDTLPVVAQTIMVTSVLGLILFMHSMPERNRTVTEPRASLIKAVKMVWHSRPYRTLISGFLIVQSANALTAGLMVLFITHRLNAPNLIGLLMGLLLLSSALFLPVWVWVSKRKSKQYAWSCSVITCSVVLAAFAFVGEGNVVAAAMLAAILGACFGCDAIMPTSMLADIVYKGEEGGKKRLGGLSLAVKNSVSKLAFVVPMGLAFPVLDLVGFQEQGQNGCTEMLTLVFFFSGLPILLRLAALYVINKQSDTVRSTQEAEPV